MGTCIEFKQMHRTWTIDQLMKLPSFLDPYHCDSWGEQPFKYLPPLATLKSYLPSRANAVSLKVGDTPTNVLVLLWTSWYCVTWPRPQETRWCCQRRVRNGPGPQFARLSPPLCTRGVVSER